MVKSLGPACISREFSVLALKKTSPVTVWLRALAAHEHERCGGPGVGAVGMCFTGGFALAMMVDDTVVAPVLSQPSLPFPVTKKHKADIGISDADLAQVKATGGRGSVRHRAAVHRTTRSASPSASRRCAGSSVTASSPWSSIRHRAIPTGTPRTPTRCSPSISTTARARRPGPRLDQVLRFFTERLHIP